jgi:hypothetical protein
MCAIYKLGNDAKAKQTIANKIFAAGIKTLEHNALFPIARGGG